MLVVCALSACEKTPAAPVATTEKTESASSLPAIGLDVFAGTVIGIAEEGQQTASQFDNVKVGGMTIIYTGAKCDVVPETSVCICVAQPSNSMCKSK